MMRVRGSVAGRWSLVLARASLQDVTKPLLVLPIVALLAVGWDWPWRLGFFADDWMVLMHPAPGSWQALKDVFALVSNRPASAPLFWLAQVMAGWSPSRAQVLNLVAYLLTAAAVGALVARLLPNEWTTREQRRVAAIVAATIYVLLPWNAAMFSWSVSMLAAAPATALFCCGMAILVDRAPHGTTRQVAAYGMLAASHLSYEALYLQEVCILLMAAVLRGRHIDRGLVRQIGAVVALTLCCLAYNRLMPGTIHKAFSADWLATFLQGHRRLPQMLTEALREQSFATTLTAIAAAAAGAVGLASRVGSLRLGAICVLAVVGVAGSGLLYALAGYGLSLKGVMARTAMALSLYVAVLAGLFAAALLAGRWQRDRLAVAGAACLVVCIAGLYLTSRERVAEWAAVWRHEARRIASLPMDLTPVGGDRRLYVLQDSYETEAIHAASAPWEVAGLVAFSSYVRTGVRPIEFAAESWGTRPRIRWFTTPPGWWTRWDGRSLAQAPCTSPVGVYIGQGASLYVWRLDQTRLRDVSAGWETGCSSSP